jgi:hypothetical protein
VRREDEGGRVIFLSTPPHQRTQIYPGRGGGVHPSPFHRLSGSTLDSLYRSEPTLHLPLCHILRRVGIPWPPQDPTQDRKCNEKIES